MKPESPAARSGPCRGEAPRSGAERGRKRSMLVMWSVALGMLVALGLVCWAVGVPVLRMRTHVSGMEYVVPGQLRVLYPRGGAARAIRDIRLYVQMPEWIAPRKPMVVMLLAQCGDEALPLLQEILSDRKGKLAEYAAFALHSMAKRDDRAVDLLLAALRDRSAPSEVSIHAVSALMIACIDGDIWAMRNEKGGTDFLLSGNGRKGPDGEPMAPKLMPATPRVVSALTDVVLDTTRPRDVRDAAERALKTVRLVREGQTASQALFETSGVLDRK